MLRTSLAGAGARVLAAAIAPALVLALLLAAPAARADLDRYVLDPDHVSVGFLVDHVGYAKTLGMFRRVKGSYRFDDATGRLTDLRIEIDAASVFTNHEKRDQHLRNRDFLDVERFPKLVYTATSARRTGERTFAIDGQLELLGQRRPVTLTATWNKSEPYPLLLAPLQRSVVMGVSARGSFRRSDFGMKYAVENGWVGDEVQLIVELEARRE
ncbi:MAG: YceI family protein [Steroidobacteraceae bacterium]|jgi:polyisoprenoid-binding protein YceI|nr:YceI family protein [Steroidobacteraceae bacterium]